MVPAHYFEKDALLKKGGYDSDLECQDGFDLWMKVALDNQVRNVNLPLFYYRQHPESLSTNTNRLLEARISVLTKKRQDQKCWRRRIDGCDFAKFRKIWLEQLLQRDFG